jgi:ATP/maltotriose-dependent transcriptional regulator MalT
MVKVADTAIPLLEKLGDDHGLSRAWWLKSEVHVNACRWATRAENIERALEYARRAGDVGEQAALSALLAQALHYGPTPVSEAIRRCEEMLATVTPDRALQAGLHSTMGALRAMEGDFDEARSLWNEARTVYEELGLRARRAGRSLVAAEIEMLAGNPGEAVAILRWACDLLDELGIHSIRATTGAFLADALSASGDFREARRYAAEAARHGAPDDVVTQAMWRIARSKADGDSELAEEAGRLAEQTDYPDLKARALIALGDVTEARRIYEEKGNVAAVALLSAHAGSS